jgi:hypothetical protein
MSALDTPNIMYELEASRAEIGRQLGVRSTLVGEMPYDTEAERAFRLMLEVFPAARSRPWFRHTMETYRPGTGSLPESEREYVQRRHTVYTRSTVEEMNGWVDHAANNDNVWFVTVIHGIDGVGWEPNPAEEIDAHFRHIASLGNVLWIATFGDVTRYIKERMSAIVTATASNGTIEVTVDHPLDKALFDLPLTLKTHVDPAWRSVRVSQGGAEVVVPVTREGSAAYVLYPATPGDQKISLKKQ